MRRFLPFLLILPIGLGGAMASAPAIKQIILFRATVIRLRPVVVDTSSWHERSGPRCIPLARIGGATLGRPDSVDLAMIEGSAVRAELDKDCPPLDVRWGLYVQPAADRLLCAHRDILRSRSGESCQVTRLRQLVPPR